MVYGEKYLFFLYGSRGLKGCISKILLVFICRFSFFSKLYGFFQKTKRSSKKVLPFIKKFEVDSSEFEKKIEEFSSFNDFFIRKLRAGVRPIDKEANIAIMPADGRYQFFDPIKKCHFFNVKGKRFCLETFLDSKKLASEFENGSMLLARLCPTDYHRFHFPFDCVPSQSKLINGGYYSVNPIALKKRMGILLENKRYITELKSDSFKKVLFVEIGATNVGTVCQTYSPGNYYKKGDEKGFFSFGGSAIALIFQENVITFDEDLTNASKEGYEVKGEMGMRFALIRDKV